MGLSPKIKVTSAKKGVGGDGYGLYGKEGTRIRMERYIY